MTKMMQRRDRAGLEYFEAQKWRTVKGVLRQCHRNQKPYGLYLVLVVCMHTTSYKLSCRIEMSSSSTS